jgi:ankyrin repeat protein
MALLVLPPSPHLDHLKRQAKDLVKAGKARKLSEAQLAIARRYGFPNWAKLKARVDASGDIAKATDAFLSASASGDAKKARDIFKARPEIAETSLSVAAVLGEIEIVQRFLAADSKAAKLKAGEPKREPLHWLCYSPFCSKRGPQILRCAEALLAAGADPDAHTVERDGKHEYPLGALYAAACHAKFPKLVKLLLDAGADPDDGETIFHAAEADDRVVLKLMVDYKADLNFNKSWGNTAIYFNLGHKEGSRFVEASNRGIRWLMQHGADPNVPSTPMRETALQLAARSRGPETVRMLLEHGADVALKRKDGRTAWALAMRAGRIDNARLLEAHGAKTERLSDGDALLAACGRGDDDVARHLSAAIATLGPDDLRLLPDAASDGRLATVRACLAAGFPLDIQGDFTGTALQHAAMQGYPDVVKEILRHKPDLTKRDPTFDGDALGWALHGADNIRRPGSDYAAVVEMLFDAGLKPRRNDYTSTDPRVLEVLKRRLK